MRGNIHGGKQLRSDKKCLGVYITSEMHSKLIEIAKQESLSLSDIVRVAIKDYLAKVA